MFCVVRNPLDVIPSFAYLIHTWGHSLVPNEQLHQSFPEWWTQWVKSIAQQLQWNHDYIVNKVSKEIPTYFIRYEDLVLDPEKGRIQVPDFPGA